MRECPLCGQSTYKASRRLIKDACGHTKCRLCLLHEENGCSICKDENIEKFLHRNNYNDNFETPSYESDSNKPLELVNKVPEKSSHISCLYVDRRSTINKNSQNVQKKQYIEIEKECNKIKKNKIIYYKTTDKEFTNDEKQNNHPSSFNLPKINQLNSIVDEPVENTSIKFYSANDSVTVQKLSSDNNENVVERVENENEKEKEDSIQLNIMPLKLVVEKIAEKNQYNNSLTMEENFTTENTTGSERVEENQKENFDGDNSNKTPNYSLCNRSPDFRISDYLLFKNRNEKTIQNELIVSPAYSLGYRSPDFRLSDYILFKKKTPIEENITEIEEENQNKKVDHNKLDIAPLSLITNQNSSNFYKPDSSSTEKRIVMDEDAVEKEKQSSIERVNYDHLKCYEFPSYSVIEKQLRDTENFKDKVDNSCNKEKVTELNSAPGESVPKNSNNPESINCSETEEAVKTNECNDLEVNQSGKIDAVMEDDEDKENKEIFNERKEREINTREENNDEVLESLISVDCEHCKIKDKMEENHSIGKDKKENSLTCQLKHKNIKEENKKNDVQIAIRKGKRKRKPKVLIYEENFEEPKQVSPKRRKRNKDWSYIVTLPGNPVTYKCTFCEKVFKNPRGKWYHSSCRTGQAPFRCHVCGRTFTKHSHFEYHERMHTGNKPFRCDICSKSFVQKSKLNRHLLIHKQQNDIECAECGRRFSTKQYLKNHMTIHQNNSFKCKFCPKTFTLAFNRKRHERSHSTDRPYKCDICSKDFKGKFLLTRHRRTHEKNRPFSCHECHRVFLSKFEVQRHMSVHSDVKPYACNQCNLEFRRKDNLNRHVKHHHTVDHDLPNFEESNNKNIDDQTIDTATKVNSNAIDKSTEEVKQSNKKKTFKTKEITDNPVNNLKPKPKPKKITRSSSTSSTKSSLKTSLGLPQSHCQINLKPDLSNAVPVIRGPISIKRFTESSHLPGARFGFTQPISLEEAVVLNRRIEEKINTQDSFCNYPGLNCRINSIKRRRDSCGSNSNSNDDTASFTWKQNQERSKTVHFSKDDPNDAQKSDEPRVVKDINLHWRRRTAESLRTKTVKNKQTQGLAQN